MITVSKSRKAPRKARKSSKIVAHRTMVRNILTHWNAATAADLSSGLGWYARANGIADTLAAGAPITRAQSAGVIAALSPRCAWGTNVKGAAAMVGAYANGEGQPIVGGTNANRDKAWAILNHTGDPLDILGGPKVRAFYANIMGDLDQVTVDVWAARAAEGSKFDDAAPAGKRYIAIADAYRAVADIVGVPPRDVQAAVWTYYRRIHGAHREDPS